MDPRHIDDLSVVGSTELVDAVEQLLMSNSLILNTTFFC